MIFKSVIILSLISLFIYFAFFWNKTVPSEIITVESGKLQGILGKSRSGREYSAYYGIPFAKPPVGNLRYKSPEKEESWNGIWDASHYRSLCIQKDAFMTLMVFGSEDCLYLNVFVPKQINKSSKLLPVLAHIHGGYFQLGSAQVGDPRNLLDHDVILVTISYRVGSFGFLSTGDEVVRGNMGLKDQNAALKWIQRNIGAFGGDKSQVTVFGESAGGASVHYQMISQQSKGLFWRVIRQSGSALNYWTMFRDTKEQARQFAKKFDCPTTNSEAMVECLRKIDARTIAGFHVELQEVVRPQIDLFVPSIEVVKDEDAFITEEPIESVKHGRFNKVPALVGFNSHEGLLHSTMLAANYTKLAEAKNFIWWAPRVMHYPTDRDGISIKLRDFYFGSEEQMGKMSDKELIEKFTELWGDRLFIAGISESAILESKFNPTHLYLYEHEGGLNAGTLMYYTQHSIHPIIGIIFDRISYAFNTLILCQDVQPYVPGAAHGDEGMMLFSNSVIDFLYTRGTDEEMSKDFVKLWVDFATGKDPISFRGVNFPASKNGSLNFLRINNEPKMEEEPLKHRRKFWESLEIPLN